MTSFGRSAIHSFQVLSCMFPKTILIAFSFIAAASAAPSSGDPSIQLCFPSLGCNPIFATCSATKRNCFNFINDSVMITSQCTLFVGTNAMKQTGPRLVLSLGPA
ncbi:hypothetical protein BDP27DRAFT_238071 [Rhodocollybia butyracea]|uniref:Uncharacterized protein n=1 Tax=Rhodocollybia butyracea TaxID=206335 RepID=A0A9P5PJW7_9AGAR|nr:hypothetical protein BDP27DRAFT_238071 [Rhodocollybia butyracea]